ncbi:FAD-dependent oxidoreductase [Nibrella saemangeumensis]|uniref:FAD-dependent oxidoreductase n=1 Tax=Nibrella saemangeumensis TaxID=1084526 RepID=A0ABP8MNQ1_9BACT
MKSLIYFTATLLLLTSPLIAQPVVRTVDVCVYGGSSGGVMAAYAAKKMGKTVLLIEPGRHLGGLTTGGLGYTDIGNKYAISGLALDYYRRLGKHYGNFEQWIFEPSVAEKLFKEYIKRADVPVVFNHRIVSVKKVNGAIEEITLETPLSSVVHPVRAVRAKMFIDASYEGDLLARAGVSYTVGREANSQYKETWNGVQLLDKHQFPDGIDPYKVPGKPESGLLWGISPEKVAATGAGDKKVQAYNFRICLSSDPTNMLPITQPEGYDPSRYELLLRYLEKKPAKDLWGFLKFDLMPNKKTDINNNGPFSTDMIGMNYDYPEASYDRRAQIQREHELYTKGLLYFIGHDPRMPEHLRKEMLRWGYPKDEYTDNGHWSPQMYVREARRMIGEYVMTQANCEGKDIVNDAVGMAAYTMDSHNCQRIVIEKNGVKMVKNEGNVEVGGFPPYPISYRSLVPRQDECKNLLVPVCLSASHIAYGSIRMEPVFMVLGQSAAVAASLAIDQKQPVQRVNIAALQKILRDNPLLDGSTPDVVVDNDDAGRVTLTGDWKKDSRGGYGRSLVIDDTKGQTTKTVRFTPSLPKAGQYDVYTYLPRRPDASSQTTLLIGNGKTAQPVVLKRDAVQVVGQTSGTWVKVGRFALPAGQQSYVEITNQQADGAVVADAVQWIAVNEK